MKTRLERIHKKRTAVKKFLKQDIADLLRSDLEYNAYGRLRTLFRGKFGNSLEPYISIQFVEKLKQELPSKEMKIQLLHDLAQEFYIEWDSKALQQRLNSPTQLHEVSFTFH
ncbi:hypothetical protein VNO78_25806 [Psophocarpus tetragonolobus]|uniref:Uncharacterized protein n=1 Tax=Psophocarpus tetragonolobus TaxID=3891 RepID=A0AAN9S6J2_PSOTE